MKNEIFNIDKFNIIQDEENYYFFRALNMADNSDIEQGITVSENGEIDRIRTDRERFDGQTKYSEDSQISLEELYDHIKMHYRKDTNCISLTSNSNVAINYARGSYNDKDKYVMIKIPKSEFGKQTVFAGQYMIKELSSRIEQEIESLPEEAKQDINSYFDKIENAQSSEKLQEIIAKRYTVKEGKIDLSKAHVKKGIIYSRPQAKISSYQSLDKEQLLEINKVYAKLAILENKHILEHVIPHSLNSKLRETIGNAFSSMEVIHYGEIGRDNIIKLPKEVVDLFALIQQIDGLDKNKIEQLKLGLINAVQNDVQIPALPESDLSVKDNISIEEMYELTGGLVEYEKSNSIVKNMFYLSKSRKDAIELSNILNEILGNDYRFEEAIQYIRDNGFRIEPEIISRKSGKGVKLSESVNLNLEKEEQVLVEDIKKLSNDELEEVLQNKGFLNVQDIITKTYGNESSKIDKSKYYAEAIISQYDWKEIGIEGFKIAERNELVKRLQDRNCIEIYNKLKQAGIEEKAIPTYLLNIVTREGLYKEYVDGKLDQLLSQRKDILQNNINIEVIERFLGYYDVENTEIKLKDYQQRTFENVNEILKDHKFAQVILPTGAGKSFVALAKMQQYVQEHPNEKMLYLAPQDEILNQIKKYIVKYIHGNKDTVGKSVDEIIAEVFPNITFDTYTGLLAKRGQAIIKDQYGMIVLDELHRTGGKEWERKINTLFANQDENVKVLGITATPVRDVDGRDMAEENARKLGYTDEEIRQRKHLASNMTLENAIRMNYVVNPKIVYCKYDLISSGKMDEVKAKIDEIKDESQRAEELKKYKELRARLNTEIDAEIGEESRKKLEEDARRNLDNGIGKKEILRQNVKKGGKYIVFIPVTDQGEIEDEDGNKIGIKTGEDKIKVYQDFLNKAFEGTDIVPQCHVMLGSWNGKRKNKAGEDKNQQELNAFELDNSDETKFMIVMNKANEGLHIDGVDGIIWFRALDKDSKILYLQQLGRIINALDEDNPLPDDKRPIVIDLVNNSLTVKMEKEFKNIEPIDDLEELTIVKEWIDNHDGILPNRNSSNRQEQHYYAVLRKIQSKYAKYLDGFNEFKDFTNEQKDDIQNIINLAMEIDLWNIDLPPILKEKDSKEKLEMNPFEIRGFLKDYVEFENEIDNFERKTAYEEIIEWLETHDGQMPQSNFTKNRNVKKVFELTEEEHYQQNLMARWHDTKEWNVLKNCAGKPIEKVPEEYREKIARLRELIKEKSPCEEIIEWLETHNGKMPQSGFTENGNLKLACELTEEEHYQVKLMDRWRRWCRTNDINFLETPIEDVPKEYREKIARIRELIPQKSNVYEEIIEWLETHNGQMPKFCFYVNGGKVKLACELTEEEHYQAKLMDKWRKTKECKVLKECAGKPIEEVPKEYREKIARLRELIPKKSTVTVYEEIKEWLETHNGQMPQSGFSENGNRKKVAKLTEEEYYQQNLRDRWRHWCKAKGFKFLETPIEKVPEEYREKIARLRELIKEKSTYEKIIEWLETHNGKMPKNRFYVNGKNGKTKTVYELTEEERYQQNLMARWHRTKECIVLKKYEGKPIEEVPEEYREKIAKLREFGLGMKKSKLQRAKQQRDKSKDKNEQTKELEEQVLGQLKIRGMIYGE